MIRKFLPAALALLLVAGAAYWWVSSESTALPDLAAQAQATDAVDGEVELVADMTRGSPDAPVTMIEYSSLTCPHCATFHRNMLPRIIETYVDTGKVHYITREVFFDRYGLWAAMLARCGNEDRFHPMLDMIFDTQAEWAGARDAAQVAENLRRLGRRSGLSNDEVEACLQDNDKALAMIATYQHHAARDGIDSTPSFVIDGQRFPNFRTFEEFAAVIDAALEQ